MHNAAFGALGIDAVYLAFDVPPARLEAALSGARSLGIRQLAVSLPHKQAVMAHLDEVDATARRIGAVNTVTLCGERLVGSNTDWLGVVQALERETKLSGARAVVLGAGGAARAAVFGLLERGARVVVLTRTPERARALAGSLGAQGAGGLEDLRATEYDLLINATGVGLNEDRSPIAGNLLHPAALVMDAVYEPEQTRLLRDAKARGARTVSGKWWLVYQAAEQLRLWTGREAPVEIMSEAFDRAGRR